MNDLLWVTVGQSICQLSYILWKRDKNTNSNHDKKILRGRGLLTSTQYAPASLWSKPWYNSWERTVPKTQTDSLLLIVSRQTSSPFVVLYRAHPEVHTPGSGRLESCRRSSQTCEEYLGAWGNKTNEGRMRSSSLALALLSWYFFSLQDKE